MHTSYYIVSRKKYHSIIFASNFAKCLPIFKVLSLTDLAVVKISGKAVTKYPTTP